MSKSSIDKKEFLKSSSILKSVIINFLNEIDHIEYQQGFQKSFFENVVISFKKIIGDLTEWEQQENPDLYDMLINSVIISIQQHKEIIAQKTSSLAYASEMKRTLLLLDDIFMQKPPARDIKKPLPRIMHRIWFGSFLPSDYQEYLFNFKKHNPHFRIMLWTDFDGLSLKEINEFKTFCLENNIILINIREHSDLLNYSLIEQELDEGNRYDTQNKGVHLVRASDLARVSILYLLGGLYSDTDTDCCKPLPDFNLDVGLIIKKSAHAGGMIVYNTLNSGEVVYDFIGALAGNKLLALSADISKLDYETYSVSKNLEWTSSKLREIHQKSTIFFTGYSLIEVISYIVKISGQHSELLDNLFIKCESFMPSLYDKSWLKHLNPESVATSPDSQNMIADEESLNRFKSEINLQRSNFLARLNASLINKEVFEEKQKNALCSKRNTVCLSSGSVSAVPVSFFQPKPAVGFQSLEEELFNLCWDATNMKRIKEILSSENSEHISINEQFDWNKDTCLIRAARRGHKELVGILLEYNADPDITSFTGGTAAQVARKEIRELIELWSSNRSEAYNTKFSEPAIGLINKMSIENSKALKQKHKRARALFWQERSTDVSDKMELEEELDDSIEMQNTTRINGFCILQ
jgi:hypothetical protein